AGLILHAHEPVLVPPFPSPAIDGSAPGNFHVLLFVNIDQGRRPFHFDTGNTRPDRGVVSITLTTKQGDSGIDPQMHVTLEKYCASDIAPGFERDYAATTSSADIDRFLNGFG